MQGNIVAILDKRGNVVVEYSYDAWGINTIIDGSDMLLATLNPFRYRGYYYDTETGLYFLKSRYYDPEIGRFISIDGIEYLDPESINGLNLYAYCNNNPVMNIDPNGTFGLFAFCMCVVIGALVVGAGAATYTGVTAYNNGVRGWDLVGAIGIGFVQGAFVGALIGATIGGMIYMAPGIASFLGSSFTFGGVALAGGGSAAITLTGAQIAAAGLAALAAMGIMFAEWQPGSWPGDDPTLSPGDGFEWRGKKPIGGDKGAWYNSFTRDSLHPDLNHPAGIEPHWDWINKLLNIAKRIFR